MDSEITFFARTNWRNKSEVFGIKQADRLLHTYIIGKTGTGKSTLLKTMFMQDVFAGRGVCLLDPHGDLASEIMASIPKDNLGDVVYFNMPDIALNLRYNPFKRVSYEKRSLVASGILDVFKKLWAEAWGVKLEHILRHTILALLDQPEATLADIPRMLLDRSFRTAAVGNIENDSVRSFWQKEFGVFKWYDFLPVLNKIGGMLAHPVIKRVLVENEYEVFLRKAMDDGKIIVVNLAKGHIGEDAAHLLGSLFVSSLSAAAFSRADTPEHLRLPFMLYADEFHHFTTLSFVGMLSELRKFKVGMVLAHQYIQQLDIEIRHAIFGNIGTIISFRLGVEDAKALAQEMYPTFDFENFMNLPNHAIYIKLMINGVPTRPFNAQTLAFKIR